MRYLFIALAFMLSLSCKKDNNKNALIGKWESIAWWAPIGGPWGGCSCWKDFTSIERHKITFNINGTYTLEKPLIASSFGCTQEYERPNDSTIVWKKCDMGEVSNKIWFEDGFLIIEDFSFATLQRTKYKRAR
jgi:hypothetical protein